MATFMCEDGYTFKNLIVKSILSDVLSTYLTYKVENWNINWSRFFRSETSLHYFFINNNVENPCVYAVQSHLNIVVITPLYVHNSSFQKSNIDLLLDYFSELIVKRAPFNQRLLNAYNFVCYFYFEKDPESTFSLHKNAENVDTNLFGISLFSKANEYKFEFTFDANLKVNKLVPLSSSLSPSFALPSTTSLSPFTLPSLPSLPSFSISPSISPSAIPSSTTLSATPAFTLSSTTPSTTPVSTTPSISSSFTMPSFTSNTPSVASSVKPAFTMPSFTSNTPSVASSVKPAFTMPSFTTNTPSVAPTNGFGNTTNGFGNGFGNTTNGFGNTTNAFGNGFGNTNTTNGFGTFGNKNPFASNKVIVNDPFKKR